jgi:photosystem II stability/assembly factor-like uncharacterized protein
VKIYCLVLLLFIYSTACAQWQWSNPKPSGYINNKVVFSDAQDGLIVNNNGDLLRTSDQGNSWHIQQNLTLAHTIDYKDSTTVIGAFGSVYVSTDFGQTWTKRSINQPEWFEVQVISRDTIFIASSFAGSPTHIFLSVNRGNTWQPVNTSLAIKSFWMLTSHEGFATSYGGIYKTTDGGFTWQIPDSTAPASGTYIKFRNKDNGFAMGQGHLWRTIDGGLHWMASASQIASGINSIEFIDANTLIAVAEGIIFRSTDNGVTWQAVVTGPSDAYDLYSVCFVNPNIGFTVGHRGRILRTTDAGLTWTQYAPTYIDMDAAHFITDSIGFAAAWNNIYKTTDAGSSWSPLSLTTASNFDRFRYIHFFNKDTGLAMAETPVRIYKTYNGGTSWQEINLNILYNDAISGAFFLNRTIYLSTTGPYLPRVLRSLDAGETWTVQDTSLMYGPFYKNPFFTDIKTGYAVYGYSVYKTIDSAKTWNQLVMLPVQLLRSVWFTNDTTGYAVGDQSYITKTSDSGHTWTQLHIDPTNNNVPGDLKQVRFFDQKIGFVINGRNVYRTINGGNSWTLHGTPGWDLTGIEISPDSSLYLYGIYGSILKRSIRTFEIDSLSFDSVTSCSSRLSATVSAVFSSVDSVWFQYGTTGYDSTVLATPFSINDTSLKLRSALNSLSQNTNYIARVRILYDGNYYYSNSITFITDSQPTPIITLNGGTLFSSSFQGNQWYVDNVLIPGATQYTYTPLRSGSYTVRSTIGACVSAVSSPFAYYVTAITYPLLESTIRIFPNPVTNTLHIENNELKKLEIKIFDVVGHAVSTQLTSLKENSFDMRSLSAGTYLVSIREIKTSKSVQMVVIKF